jgi:ABC-2 type transport system permease protein
MRSWCSWTGRGGNGLSAVDVLVPIFFLLALPAIAVSATTGFRGLRPAFALMRRRMQVYLSYPFAVFATILHGVVLAVIVATVGAHLFPEIREFTLQGDGDTIRLVTYLTVGLIAWPAIWEGYEITRTNIRAEQTTGIFETLLATPVGVRVLPLAYLFITLPVALVVATVAYFLFTHFGGVVFPLAGPVMVVNVVLVLMTGVFMTWGLGLFLGALATIVKETGPIGGLLKMVMLVFSNIYIPIAVFPQVIQWFSVILPLTWAFASIRHVFAGNPVTTGMETYLVFLAYTLLLIMAGLYVFSRAVERARREGTTGSY